MQYIPRAKNAKADELVKAAAKAFYQVLQAPATQVTTKAFKTVLVTE